MANFLPALPLCDRWEMTAEILVDETTGVTASKISPRVQTHSSKSEKRLLNESAREAEAGSPSRAPSASAVVRSSADSASRRFSCPERGRTGPWNWSYHSRTTASSVSARSRSGSYEAAQLSSTVLRRASFLVIYRTEPRSSSATWSARSKAACSKCKCGDQLEACYSSNTMQQEVRLTSLLARQSRYGAILNPHQISTGRFNRRSNAEEPKWSNEEILDSSKGE
jgi:hypothetical protein